MTVKERLSDVQRRLSYAYEIKNLRPEDWQAILVSIIRDCQRDGAEREREACAKVADEQAQLEASLANEAKLEGKELSGVGHTFGETAAWAIGRKIRARKDAAA